MNTTITKKSILLRTAMTLGRRLVMTLLLTLMTVAAGADGAKTLPYSYSFENDLEAEGWTIVDGSLMNNGISNGNPPHANYYFIYCDEDNPTQYLVSPEIDSGNNEMIVSFYYINSDRSEQTATFQVGYSTTTNDVKASEVFTWFDKVPFVEFDWILHEAEIPAGAKYVAIKFNSNLINGGNRIKSFNLADFLFAVNGCLPPENLKASDITDQTATLTWSAPETGENITDYAYQYKKVSESTWSAEETTTNTSATISGLSANTSYDIRVKANYGGTKSSDYVTITILTDCSGAMSLPLDEDFENGMGCWRAVDGGRNTGIARPYTIIGIDNQIFQFVGDAPQYLTSPQVYNNSKKTVSLRYAVDNPDNPMTFQVGYSSTTDAFSAFTWGEEITSSNTILNWENYEETYPADTKYVAVKYCSVSNNIINNRLLIDDFKIFVEGALPPAQVSASNITCENVTLTWTAPTTDKTITGYAYQYKKVSESTWSDLATTTAISAAISGLTVDTDYDFRVKAIYGSDYSVYTYTQFTTTMAFPYEMDFENDMGRWRMVDCDVDYTAGVDYPIYTGRRTQAAYNGNVGFMFNKNILRDDPQYLISPRLAGNAPIVVSFYYGNLALAYSEAFQVGYSTTTSDISEFTFGDVINATDAFWHKFEKNDFPSGTKYVAIKYTSNTYKLYIDNIVFEEYSSYAKPTTILFPDLSDTKAELVWDDPALNDPDQPVSAWAYQFKKASDSKWSEETILNINTVTLNNLSPNTNYNFRVRAFYGSNASNYATTRFQTFGSVVSLPYTDGFENGMGGWRMHNCGVQTGIKTSDEAHNGARLFFFHESKDFQYLQSPHFAGGKPMKVSFYYKNAENCTTGFNVGYAESNKYITWDEMLTIGYDGKWKLYEVICPPEAQYFMINNFVGDLLYLDDFSFETLTTIPLTITAASDTKPYDGTPLTKNNYQNTRLMLGDHIESVTVTGSQTDIGSSENVPSNAVIKNKDGVDVTDRYEITYVPGTLTVSDKVSITFAKEGFSTYYDSKYNLTLPEGVKAYIVTASEGAGSLTYQAIADGDGATNTVPKGTAVMLRTAASDAAQNIEIQLSSLMTEGISETNLLHGSDTEITTTGGDAGAKYYKLSYGTDQTGNGGDDLTSVLGWFWGAADGAAFTSAAHKAWLVLPSTAGTRGFFGLPGDDETTLLRKVNSEEVNSEEWFSLDGRRLNGRPSAKGLYIHNGSKVAIK